MDSSDMAKKTRKPSLPPCGYYRTLQKIGPVASGKLVYFHNHGDPGPGIYLPGEWSGNRAIFKEKGHTLPAPVLASPSSYLHPLADEGYYRVRRPFHCCEQRCFRFDVNTLVQLGYDGDAQAILFIPHEVDGGLEVPEDGTRVDEETIANLEPLHTAPHPEEEEDEGFDLPPLAATGSQLWN